MLMINQFLIVALVCTICNHWAVLSVTGQQLSCVDESGKPLDWYIGYKFPRLKGDEEFDTGDVYAYVSNEDTKQEANADIQFNRRVEDDNAKIFLRQFMDLLTKFAGSFNRQEILKPVPAGPRTRSRTPSPSRAELSEKDIKKIKWEKSKLGINETDSVLLKTLKPAYDPGKFNKISSIFYNDDPRSTKAPDKLFDRSSSSRSETDAGDFISESESDEDSDDEPATPTSGKKKKKATGPWQRRPSRAAHAKGVILMDEKSNTGVWITHSIPRFPEIRAKDSKLEYPKSGMKFAQTFMCITFDLEKSGTKLFNHLINIRPLVYDRMVTDTLLERFPRLKYLDLWIKMTRGSTRGANKPAELTQVITTKAGQILNLFSKPSSVEKDLYGFIDDKIGADLYVETWRNGAGTKINSNCPRNDFHINNVENLKYRDNESWGYQLDHSKWAISFEQDIATVCIGDSNRMESQFKRGGGAVCIRDPTTWALFDNTVVGVEACPMGEKKGVGQSVNVDPTLKNRVEQYMKAVTGGSKQ